MTTIIIPGVPLSLTPEGHPPCEHRLDNGALILRAAAGTDMFIDPSGAAPATETGRLTDVPPDGDLAIAARVTVEFASRYDAGVLLVHSGERRWAKLCFELSPQLRPTAVTVVTRQTSDDCNSFEVTGSELWLRMTRTGPAWAFHASTDGSWWRLLRYFALGEDGRDGADPVRVGFLAQSPTGAGCTARFDHITMRNSAPADLRDGS